MNNYYNIDNTLLVQGQMAKRVLLDKFVATDDAVLLATASFWEGIDVRGDKLTCVIIDKLPFASPDDPLLQARCEDVRRQGGERQRQEVRRHSVRGKRLEGKEECLTPSLFLQSPFHCGSPCIESSTMKGDCKIFPTRPGCRFSYVFSGVLFYFGYIKF